MVDQPLSRAWIATRRQCPSQRRAHRLQRFIPAPWAGAASATTCRRRSSSSHGAIGDMLHRAQHPGAVRRQQRAVVLGGMSQRADPRLRHQLPRWPGGPLLARGTSLASPVPSRSPANTATTSVPFDPDALVVTIPQSAKLPTRWPAAGARPFAGHDAHRSPSATLARVVARARERAGLHHARGPEIGVALDYGRSPRSSPRLPADAGPPGCAGGSVAGKPHLSAAPPCHQHCNKVLEPEDQIRAWSGEFAGRTTRALPGAVAGTTRIALEGAR